MRMIIYIIFFLIGPFTLFAQTNNSENARKPVQNSNGLNLSKAPRNELKVVDPKQVMERQKKIAQMEDNEKEFIKFAESDGKTSPYETLILKGYKVTKENIR